jgi:hypothetical protein
MTAGEVTKSLSKYFILLEVGDEKSRDFLHRHAGHCIDILDTGRRCCVGLFYITGLLRLSWRHANNVQWMPSARRAWKPERRDQCQGSD